MFLKGNYFPIVLTIILLEYSFLCNFTYLIHILTLIQCRHTDLIQEAIDDYYSICQDNTVVFMALYPYECLYYIVALTAFYCNFLLFCFLSN